MSKQKKVVIFIPAYNEEDTILTIINKTKNYFSNSQKMGFIVEILVVDDGSTDKTAEIIKNVEGVTIVSHPTNLGLGAATRTAMQTAYEMEADVAVKLDADCQHTVEDVEKVVRPLLEDKADLCWGSRFKGKINYKMPFIRLWGNYFFTWLMNWLTNFKITDAQTGLMAFNRKYLSKFELWGNYNPPQQLLIDASSKYMRYTEVPVTFNPRASGKSFVNLKYPIKVIPNILRLLIYANPLKVFGGLGLFFILGAFLWVFFYIIGAYFKFEYIKHFPTYIGLVLFISGVQIICFAVLADLILKKDRHR